jgi:hypothetical protein
VILQQSVVDGVFVDAAQCGDEEFDSSSATAAVSTNDHVCSNDAGELFDL